MKTESHSINDVLAKNATSFFIPPFQRAYAWGRPEIERYFSDISRIIESEIDKKQHDKLEHLLKYSADKFQRVELTEEVIKLADTYIDEKVVERTSLEDCRHIAMATIHKVDVLASWSR